MLSLLVVVAIGAGLITLAQVLRIARLRRIAKAAQRRFAGDGRRIVERFALVEAIDSEANARRARLLLPIAMIEPRDGELALVRDGHRLTPPADLRGLTSNLGFADVLEGQGIPMVNDLAVEAKATKAANTCLRAANWASQSLQTMAEMIASPRDTLAKARGNELLEPAIPQLEEALGTFTQKEDKLTSHLQDSSGCWANFTTSRACRRCSGRS